MTAAKVLTNKRILSVKEASEYFGGRPSVSTLNKWRKTGKGPRYVKMETFVGYPVDALNQYLEDSGKSPKDDFEA